MKRKSFIAILAAVAMLSGCASSNVANVGDAPASTVGEKDPMPTAPESAAPGTSGGSSVTNAESGAAVGSESSAVEGGSPVSGGSGGSGAGTSTAPAEPSGTTGSRAETEPAAPDSSTAPATTAAPLTTTVPATTAATHSDPSGADYKGTDVGGTGVRDTAAEDGEICEGISFDGLAFDAFDDAMAVDGAYAEADCCPEPCPIEPTEPQIPPEAGLLTGGEWRDNDNWEFWQSLYGSENYSVDWESYRDEWRTGADFRLEVMVKDSDGELVSGAKVSTDEPHYSAVTDNRGMAYLFYSQEQVINGFTTLTVTFGDITAEEKLTLGGDSRVEVTLDAAAKQSAQTLDLMIMCDTTGSMWDELDYLKAELEDVVTRIKKENANIPTRLSVNFYRDEGDEYVVREFPFTQDLDAAVNAISQQYADGGGDTPEAVHTALESAINSHDWDENSVKIMFLVLDAPPHSDVQIIDQTVKLVKQAADKGIRIIPVASSGIDKSTEYLLRSMAFMTGGTYVFLTDDSGIGGSHIEPTIGSYDVEKLNDMMVRIVGDYLD